MDKNSSIEIKQVWDYFPDLFENEKNKYMKQKEENELEEYKKKKRKYAAVHNSMRKIGDNEGH